MNIAPLLSLKDIIFFIRGQAFIGVGEGRGDWSWIGD